MTTDDTDEKVHLLQNDNVSINDEAVAAKKKQKMLLISFLLMVIIGLGNKLFYKFMMKPMANYPYFLSVYTTFVYIPVSFAYIWPMLIWGRQITPEQRQIPWYVFCIMGCLDGISGLMSTFATNYIFSGSLVVLLTQSAIPISMVISRFLLKAKYTIQHYIGAFIVLIGLVVVLIPQFVGKHPHEADQTVSGAMMGVWCGVLVASCIPMALSSVYKEKALGEAEIDVVYLNGWVAIWQFAFTILMAIPSAYASNLTVQTLPKNFWDGMKCYVGVNSILHESTHGSHKILADACGSAPFYVNVYIAFNLAYNVLIIMILKYGSSNLLYLALTVMVPMSSTAFALPFVPNHVKLTPFDIIGLVVIMVGLVIYRFWGSFYGYVKVYILRKPEKPLKEMRNSKRTSSEA